MKKFFKKIGAALKKVPWYGWVFGVLMIALDIASYNGSSAIIRANPAIAERAIVPKINAIDDAIPLIPYFFVQVYLLCFPFWFCGPVIASVTKKDNFLNYMIGLFAAYLIGFVIFLAVPTVMDRNAEGIIQKVNEGKGFSWSLMQLMLKSDGGGLNYNLLPSFHCMISLWVFLGSYKQKEVPIGVQIGNGVFTILVLFSTLFTKQHYFVDMPFGLLLAILTYFLVKLIKPGERIVKKWPNIFVIKRKKKNLSKNNKASDSKIESK